MTCSNNCVFTSFKVNVEGKLPLIFSSRFDFEEKNKKLTAPELKFRETIHTFGTFDLE